MPTIIKYPPRPFSTRTIRGVAIRPYILLTEIKTAGQGKLSYSARTAEHLAQLRQAGVFNLPPQISYAGDALRNSPITPEQWFFTGNNTNRLFQEEVSRHSGQSLIISSNAGNAPLHEWEVNYVRGDNPALAARDLETPKRPLAQRDYSCVFWGPELGIQLGNVRFTTEGEPLNPKINVAVGGRPLVNHGEATALSTVLETSVTDPRHVLLLPEVALERGIHLPIGLRSIQTYLHNHEAADLIDRVKAGDFILINLEQERECCGNIPDDLIKQTLLMFGYQPEDFTFSGNSLALRLRFNYYRHTFWAKQGDSIFIGIINNPLPANNGKFDPLVYNRVLKPTGLSIPELQDFLTSTLKVEEAVLMGNGKDPRIYTSLAPHDPSQVECQHDSDVDISGRSSLSAGLVTLII